MTRQHIPDDAIDRVTYNLTGPDRRMRECDEERLRAELDALGSLDGIRTAALALPVDDRNALRMALAESLPIPRCFDTSPALMAKAAQTMTAAEVEELIGLLTNRRPS